MATLPTRHTEADIETTIIEERLHWSIFLPVIYIALALGASFLPVFIGFRAFSGLFRGSGVQMPSLWPFALVFLLMPAALAVFCAIAYKTCIYTVTNKRILYRIGLFSRTEGELPLTNVESLSISESFVGRLLGYGSVMLTTAGGAVMPFSNIREPRAFHAKLQRAIEDSKRPARPIAKPIEPPPQDDSRYMPKA